MESFSRITLYCLEIGHDQHLVTDTTRYLLSRDPQLCTIDEVFQARVRDALVPLVSSSSQPIDQTSSRGLSRTTTRTLTMALSSVSRDSAPENNAVAPVPDVLGDQVQSVADPSMSIPIPAWNDDPSNPHNWPASRKYVNTILLSALVFNTLMSSTMVAPALSQIRIDLKIVTDTQTQLVLSIFVLAYAVGYFVWAPLSEVYGRKQILQIANFWFLIWNLVCGFARNEATITVGRLFSGAGAAACLALGSGTMGEVWRPVQRGRSLAVLSIITNLGPAVGPLIGGAIAQQSVSSWRWAFWSTSIFNGLLQLISLQFLHESHRATILRKKYPSICDDHTTKEQRTIQVLITAFKRPFYLLLTYPASQGLAVYTYFTFGTLYILLSVIPIAFTTIHGQSIMIASLNYLAFGIGTTFGAQVCAPVIDFLYRRKARLLKTQAATRQEADESLQRSVSNTVPPEIRLYPFVPTILLMSGGLLVFGWTLQAHTHWIGTSFGIFMFGAGNQSMTQCTNAYTIDIFSEIKMPAKPRLNKAEEVHGDEKPGSQTTCATDAASQRAPDVSVNWSASAMASIWAAKSLGGFAFPLFAIDMIDHLGWGWSGTLLALVNIAVGVPLAIVLLVWGVRLRKVGSKRIERSMGLGKM